MEKAQHTPGPWVVNGEARYAGFNVVDKTGRSVAAFPSNSKRPDDERNANAHLIAAAPELLAALEGLEWAVSGLAYVQEEYSDQVAAAQAAIAKARRAGK